MYDTNRKTIISHISYLVKLLWMCSYVKAGNNMSNCVCTIYTNLSLVLWYKEMWFDITYNYSFSYILFYFIISICAILLFFVHLLWLSFTMPFLKWQALYLDHRTWLLSNQSINQNIHRIIDHKCKKKYVCCEISERNFVYKTMKKSNGSVATIVD